MDVTQDTPCWPQLTVKGAGRVQSDAAGDCNDCRDIGGGFSGGGGIGRSGSEIGLESPIG